MVFTSNRTEDVVIIGGGPGGLMTAKILAEKGLSPLLLEEHQEFYVKPCGCAISGKVYGISFPDLIDDKEIIEREFDHITVYYYGKKHTLRLSSLMAKWTRISSPPFLMINKKKFEESLARQAKKAGARILLGAKVGRLAREKDLIVVNNRIKTRILIGADGFHSVVRRFVGEPPPKETTLALEKEVELKQNFDYPTIFVDSKEIIERGAAWVFPKKGLYNVGIGSIGEENHKYVGPGWRRFAARLEIESKQNPKGALIPMCIPRKTYFNNILLVGDAGSFADPFTGGGISAALKSGEFAAYTALEAIKEKNYSEYFLKRYEIRWRKAMYKRYLYRFLQKKVFLAGFFNHPKVTNFILSYILGY